MTDALLEQVLASYEHRHAVVVATALPGGAQRLVEEGDPLEDDAALALREERCRTVERDGEVWFLRPYNPPLRLVIVGAVHIAQVLTTMAAQAGFEVTVLDPRSAFCTPARFPGVALCSDWPDVGLAALGLDDRTAIVTMTHDPKLDDPALAAAIASPAFYVGALGSTRTHAERRSRLQAHGHAQLDRIHGPVGLDIGARSPAEIAVSILAELICALRKP